MHRLRVRGTPLYAREHLWEVCSTLGAPHRGTINLYSPRHECYGFQDGGLYGRTQYGFFDGRAGTWVSAPMAPIRLGAPLAPIRAVSPATPLAPLAPIYETAARTPPTRRHVGESIHLASVGAGGVVCASITNVGHGADGTVGTSGAAVTTGGIGANGRRAPARAASGERVVRGGHRQLPAIAEAV